MIHSIFIKGEPTHPDDTFDLQLTHSRIGQSYIWAPSAFMAILSLYERLKLMKNQRSIGGWEIPSYRKLDTGGVFRILNDCTLGPFLFPLKKNKYFLVGREITF